MASSSVKTIFKSRLEILACNKKINVPEATFRELSQRAREMMVDLIPKTHLSEVLTAELASMVTDGPMLEEDSRAVVSALCAAQCCSTMPTTVDTHGCLVNAETIVEYFTAEAFMRLGSRSLNN